MQGRHLTKSVIRSDPCFISITGRMEDGLQKEQTYAERLVRKPLHSSDERKKA